MIFLLILATVRPSTIQLSTTQSFQLKESGNLQCWKASFSRSDPIVISRGNRCALLSSGNPANWFNVYRQTYDWRHLIPSHTTLHVVPCHTLSHSRCFGPGGSVLKNTSTRRLLDIDSSWSLAGQGEVVPEQGRAFGQPVHGYNLGVLIEDTMKIPVPEMTPTGRYSMLIIHHQQAYSLITIQQPFLYAPTWWISMDFWRLQVAQIDLSSSFASAELATAGWFILLHAAAGFVRTRVSGFRGQVDL